MCHNISLKAQFGYGTVTSCPVRRSIICRIALARCAVDTSVTNCSFVSLAVAAQKGSKRCLAELILLLLKSIFGTMSWL